MRTRFWATMRRPACSIIALIAPVRLRAVASGLMIEKVRSIAMGLLFRESRARARVNAARRRWAGRSRTIPAPGDRSYSCGGEARQGRAAGAVREQRLSEIGPIVEIERAAAAPR